jgi:uncharacterized protein (DUF302 family)
VTTDDPQGVVTLRCEGGVDQVLRRAIGRIEGLGLEVYAVIDHSGEAAEAGLTMPDAKLVLFGSSSRETGLMLAHPRLALDLPLKLLVPEGEDGGVSVSYTAPGHLAHRYGLTDDEAEALRSVETIAAATRRDP